MVGDVGRTKFSFGSKTNLWTSLLLCELHCTALDGSSQPRSRVKLISKLVFAKSGRPGLELSSPLKIMAGGLDELKEQAPLNGIWFNNKCRITDNGVLLIGISVQTAPERSGM
ncbi:hypothetical protein L3X38_040456 [Prunus dulcis]|uniref:Uncharacterized protein n=1 Tax=Prunus dulcis TaxID=3755 RepID=A0AAD4V9J3_PRUDU|nr:hypothetical protein L3X38_040456 [Prunus dulcis]